MKYAISNFWRNKRVSISACATVLVLCVFMQVFVNSITMNRQELESAYKTIPVSAFVGGRDGVYKAELEHGAYQSIVESDFIKSYLAMCEIKPRSDGILRAVSDLAIDPTFEDYIAGIRWENERAQDFGLTDEAVCLAPAWIDIKLGDKIKFKLSGSFSKESELTVIGLYGDSNFPIGGKVHIYYCPLAFLEKVNMQANAEIIYSRLEMELTCLDRLDEFKSDMKVLGLESGSSQLVINDALLQDVTMKLRRQLRLLEGLLPVLMALALAIGFGLSFLLLRARKREAAVMRTLGAKKSFVFKVLMLETLLQAAFGAVLGTAVNAAAFGVMSLKPQYTLMLVLCYLLGGAVAVRKLSSVNIFNIMTAAD